MDTLLVDLRTCTNELFGAYFPHDIEKENTEEDTLVVGYRLTEEFALRNGKKVRLTNDGVHEQVKLTAGRKRLGIDLIPGGYRFEAATDTIFATDRRLTDETDQHSLSNKERSVLEWALEEIKWLTRNAPNIIGTDKD